MKRNKKRITLIIVVLVTICGTSLGYGIFKEKRYETTSVEDIGKYQGAFYFDIALIPKEKLDETNVIEYKYKYIENFLDDSQYIMLKYQYGDDYDAEKKRLSLIQDEYSTVTYNDTIFDFPAYIYMYKERDNSEFALVDDEKKQITYIYVQCPFDFEGELYINKDM